MSPRISRDARLVSTPVLFHVQWDDELFPRDGQLELFEQLIAFPGLHAMTDPVAIDAWCTFVVRHLS
jgi:hypothetical protein